MLKMNEKELFTRLHQMSLDPYAIKDAEIFSSVLELIHTFKTTKVDVKFNLLSK
jgi:hypothetical protein